MSVVFVYSMVTLFGGLNDQFEFHICICKFPGMFSFKKHLKICFTVVKFILSRTSSHFNLVMSSHVADFYSLKPAHAFCRSNKCFIRYCGKSINKLLQ